MVFLNLSWNLSNSSSTFRSAFHLYAEYTPRPPVHKHHQQNSQHVCDVTAVADSFDCIETNLSQISTLSLNWVDVWIKWGRLYRSKCQNANCPVRYCNLFSLNAQIKTAGAQCDQKMDISDPPFTASHKDENFQLSIQRLILRKDWNDFNISEQENRITCTTSKKQKSGSMWNAYQIQRSKKPRRKDKNSSELWSSATAL